MAMTLFLLTFFIIYGGLQFYFFAKIKAAFPLSQGASLVLIAILVLMVLAPIIVRVSERYGYEALARFMSYTGYIWMGMMFLFFVCSILLDLHSLLIHIAALISRRDLSYLALSPLSAFVIPMLISLSINTFGYFEAKDIRTERMTIRSSKIPETAGRIRVVQISDVHIGLIVREKRLKRIAAEIKKAEPDILVSTGDLVDGQINGLEGLQALLRDVHARYGKFAITGNHEFFAEIDRAINFMRASGFVVLRGEGINVAGMINIAGVDDPTGVRFGLALPISEKNMLSGLPEQYFTILLKHQPLVDKNATGVFNLQLSGHTHGGQIFPFNFITRLFFPLQRGYFDLSNNAHLYVSRGTGTWGPPIRFLSPPEITVIDLIHG
ncbi:MAG TPA: metallophosphoesterase [Syntrophales bacterium]|nr:metallophosphoesterase [Syntrophales bacterium]